ncbi:carbonic anhydrase [Nitritalea halalkaliphila LW7]|uniref:Carbonic anhydrase n=1 Tax=Nitritalea halalkaliphila LW7 TaxID=1189621 RepID=I5C9D0_9BACT|nr:carbonic anhydrase [Nitritalea halalkaliphila]EIM78432.1 carbonic anhydrase [Nitritalea halalkaliphila LW7]
MKRSYRTPLLPLLALLLLLQVASCNSPATKAPTLGEDQHTENLDKSQVLSFLLEGNKRFSEDHPIHPDQTLEKLRALSQGQHPIAAIVSCSDSRVPPELLFDQGLGDLFVIRNAGNIVSDYEIGSVEYAIEHLEVPLVIVLGHTQCGAIGAYVARVQDSTAHNATHTHATHSMYIEKNYRLHRSGRRGKGTSEKCT